MKTIQESLTNLKGLYQKEEYEKRSSGYKILESVGRGNFGQVRRAVHIDTEVQVAIKILQKGKVLQNGDFERVKREIEILARVDHPNVAYLYEVRRSDEDHRRVRLLLLRARILLQGHSRPLALRRDPLL